MAASASREPLTCSVTHLPIQQAARTSCGHVFEAGAFSKWLGRHHVCPYDYQYLSHADVQIERRASDACQRGLSQALLTEADKTFLFEWYQKGSDEGGAGAQYQLGKCFKKGIGVERSPEEAAHWFVEAAVQDNAKAQTQVGKLHNKGLGTPQNHGSAARWFRSAAILGDAKAQYHLGLLYSKGQGVSQSHKTAVYWWERASSQGHAKAKFQLSLCYAEGKGVPKNPYVSAQLLEKSAIQGYARAQCDLGYLLGTHEIESMRNFYSAFKWFRMAAENGDIDAEFNMGYCYLNGRGVEKNETLAVEKFISTADKGAPDAMFLLGICFQQGLGVEKDEEMALEWIEMSAELGYQPAIDMLERLSSEALSEKSQEEILNLPATSLFGRVVGKVFIAMLDSAHDASFNLHDNLPLSLRQHIPQIVVKPVLRIRDEYLQKFDGDRKRAAFEAVKAYRDLWKWDVQCVGTIFAPAAAAALLPGGLVTNFTVQQGVKMWRELREISIYAAIHGHDIKDPEVKRKIISCYLAANGIQLPLRLTVFVADIFRAGYRSMVQKIANVIADRLTERFYIGPMVRRVIVPIAGEVVNPTDAAYEFLLQRYFHVSSQVGAHARIAFES